MNLSIEVLRWLTHFNLGATLALLIWLAAALGTGPMHSPITVPSITANLEHVR
jgi:hypothetical protein